MKATQSPRGETRKLVMLPPRLVKHFSDRKLDALRVLQHSNHREIGTVGQPVSPGDSAQRLREVTLRKEGRETMSC